MSSVKAFVAVTDGEWYNFLRGRPDLEEVNFWQPGGGQEFKALDLGEPFLFKLRYPENAIVGGGFFSHFSLLPVSLAWQAFGEKNGAASFAAMRERIERLRRSGVSQHEDYTIGCVILADPWRQVMAWSPSRLVGCTASPSKFARASVRAASACW